MTENKYKVVLRSGVQEGYDLKTVVAHLSALVKMPEDQVEALLKRRSTVIKKALDMSTAQKYHKAIQACGAICKVKIDKSVAKNEDHHLENAFDLSDVQHVASKCDGPTKDDGEQENRSSEISAALNVTENTEPNAAALPENVEIVDENGTKPEGEQELKRTVADNYRHIDPEQDKDFIPISEITQNKRVSSTWRMAIASVMLVLASWWGATVGWPSYQTYLIRSQLTNDFNYIYEVRDKITAFIRQSGSWPTRNKQAGLDDTLSSEGIEAITLGEKSVLTVNFREGIVGRDRTLTFVPQSNDSDIIWHCKGGSLPNDFRPLGCTPLAVPSQEIQAAFVTAANEQSRARIKVPEHWSTKVSLSELAEIQAAHLEDENYLMVMSQTKEAQRKLSIVAYGEIVIEQVFTNISKPQLLSGPEKLIIDNKKGTRYLVQGVIDDVEITYLITVIEGEFNYYQVFCWTLADRFEVNKALLQSVADSFYEVELQKDPAK